MNSLFIVSDYASTFETCRKQSLEAGICRKERNFRISRRVASLAEISNQRFALDSTKPPLLLLNVMAKTEVTAIPIVMTLTTDQISRVR